MVVATLAVFLAGQEAAVLHLAKVFGRHVGSYFASFRQFSDGVLVLEQHLNDPQPVGMGQRLETLGRLLQRRERSQFLISRFGRHIESPMTNISKYYDMTIYVKGKATMETVLILGLIFAWLALQIWILPAFGIST